MPPKRPPPIILSPKTAYNNVAEEIDIRTALLKDQLKYNLGMEGLYAHVDRNKSKVAKITCTVIRPIDRQIVCIAIKNIRDHMNKVTPINTIFFNVENTWIPLSYIFNTVPYDTVGELIGILERIAEQAKAGKRAANEFSTHPETVRISNFGRYGNPDNALCSKLLKEYADDIIEQAEISGNIVVLTEDNVMDLSVMKLKRTPEGFFQIYENDCITFDIPVEHRKKKKIVSMKTRPDEYRQGTIDDMLSARFQGLRLSRKSHKSTGSTIFNRSRNARHVNLRPPKPRSKKAKKPDNKKANSGASKKANNGAAKKANNGASKKANNGAAKPDNTPK